MQVQSFSWPVSSVSIFKTTHFFGFGWIEVEAPLHSLPINFAFKSDKFSVIYLATTGCYLFNIVGHNRLKITSLSTTIFSDKLDYY
jgi:hypothetical protein